MEKQKKLVFKSAFPKYAKDKYDSFFLLKFFDTEEHRDYFLSGKLYMRQLTEFALQELGRGRSDYAEGAGLIVIPHNKERYVDFRTISKNGNLYMTDNMSLLELDTHLNFEDIAIPIRLSQFAETVRCKERQVQFIREKIKEK